MVILKEVIVYFDEDDPDSGFINFTHNDNNYKLLITVEETGEVGKNNSDHMYLMYKDGDIVKMKLKGMGATPRIITKLENIVEYLNKIEDGLFCNLYHIVKEKNAKYFSGKKVNKTNTNKINKIYRIIEEMDKFYESNCKNKNFSSMNQFNNTYLEENLIKNKYFKMFINEPQNNQPQSNQPQNNQQKRSKLDSIIKEYTDAFMELRMVGVIFWNDLNKLEKNLRDLNERKDQITKYINEYNRTTFHSYVTELEHLYKLYNRRSDQIFIKILKIFEKLKSANEKTVVNNKSQKKQQESSSLQVIESKDKMDYVKLKHDERYLNSKIKLFSNKGKITQENLDFIEEAETPREKKSRKYKIMLDILKSQSKNIPQNLSELSEHINAKLKRTQNKIQNLIKLNNEDAKKSGKDKLKQNLTNYIEELERNQKVINKFKNKIKSLRNLKNSL